MYAKTYKFTFKKKKKKTKSRTPEGGDKKLSETKKPTKE